MEKSNHVMLAGNGAQSFALKNGFRVVVVTNVNKHMDLIKSEGFELHPIKINRGGINPFADLKTIFELYKCYKKYKQFISERGFTCVPDILLKINILDTDIKFSEVPLILKYDLKIGRSKMKIFTTIIKTLKIVIKRKIGIL